MASPRSAGAGGILRRGLLAGTSVGCLSVSAAWIPPDVVFPFLINSYGDIALFVYLAIAVAQVRLRRKLEHTEPARPTLKMWLFPWLGRVAIALMALVIGARAFLPDSRSQFRLSLLTVAVVLSGYELRRRVGGRRQGVGPVGEPAGALWAGLNWCERRPSQGGYWPARRRGGRRRRRSRCRASGW
ncbi:hypothetical protein ACTPOK_05990 [Streptomyces inhibens]|uniref:hypothetical protein n=1 Tax=Streptomyces inhibens TaxID=2293571 RepID=UPI00402ADF8B